MLSSSEHDHAVEECGLRERKKLTTRTCLQEAALRLAAEHGFSHVTVEGICASAGVSVRTFFNYFSSKEEAVVGDPPELDQMLRDALGKLPPGAPVMAAMRQVIRTVGAEIDARRHEVMTRYQVLRECPQLQPRHRAIFAAREQTMTSIIAEHCGADPDDLYPALVAATGGTVLRVAMQRWADDEHCQFQDLVDELFDLLERGL